MRLRGDSPEDLGAQETYYSRNWQSRAGFGSGKLNSQSKQGLSLNFNKLNLNPLKFKVPEIWRGNREINPDWWFPSPPFKTIQKLNVEHVSGIGPQPIIHFTSSQLSLHWPTSAVIGSNPADNHCQPSANQLDIHSQLMQPSCPVSLTITVF